MLTYGGPILFTIFVWWFSTGAVLYVVGRSRPAFGISMVAATVLAAIGIYGLAVSATDTSTAGAYIAFTSALVLWGWHEMSFLTGTITGPRTTALPDGASGSARLLPAIETVIYHELALFLTLAALAFAFLGSPNEVGLWTFAILWIMRLSTKINIYLGVSNLTENFLPAHLVYLKTYFRHRPMNLLFPVSVTLATMGFTILVLAAADGSATDASAAGFTFLATLMALAILEHWFLVIPLPVEDLWAWGLTDADRESRTHAASVPLSATKPQDKAAKVPSRPALVT